MTFIPSSQTIQGSLELQSVHDNMCAWLATGAHDQAIQVLYSQIELLLEQNNWQSVHTLLSLFPVTAFEENPDLRYIEGLIYAKAGLLSEATNLLERARFSYTVQRSYNKMVICSLELARLCLSRENFRTAYYHLHEEVEPLIEQEVVDDPALRARFFLRMAELCPDVGRLRATVDYAQKALAAYKASNDSAGQFYALVRLASSALALGEYAEAASRLDMAKACHTSTHLGENARARLLNLSIHLAWYQGRLPAALAYAHTYLQLVDQEQLSNFQVYARMLLGNLQRAASQFALAEQWYAETRHLIATLHYPLYLPWVDAQTAWLRVLENRLGAARTLIHSSLKTSDLGQAMSFQVVLALINLLDDQGAVAERLLGESLAFYTTSGDGLSCCAIQMYLALVKLKRGEPTTAQDYLQRALGWLAQQRLDGFPHWWHPGLVAEACAHALAADIFPDVAERIFVNRLGKSGGDALRTLLYSDNPVARQRAGGLLTLLEGYTFTELADLDDTHSKRVLEELLQAGKLRHEGFAALKQLLMTARQRQSANSTFLATFGLYVNGYTRLGIAKQLGCSVANVRNYINLIYHIFGIGHEGFASRQDRQQQLAEIARKRRFI